MAHIHKDIDLTACAYIVYAGKVLLVLHKKLDHWVPIGGHVELDEDADQALMREIQEECGLEVFLLGPEPPVIPGAMEVKFLHVPAYFDIHKFDDTHRHMNLVYFAVSMTDKAVLATGEHYELRWFTFEELDDPAFGIWPSVKFYAKEAIERSLHFSE